MKVGTGSVKLKVMSPLSEVKVGGKNAARLDNLNGKTICELWATGHYRANETFPVIREMLQKQFPDIKFVPYTEFPSGETWKYPILNDEIGEVLKQRGCDAVLLGNGG